MDYTRESVMYTIQFRAMSVGKRSDIKRSKLMRHVIAIGCVMWCVCASVQALAQQQKPYELREVLTEEHARKMGGTVRLLSQTRALGDRGCFDISGPEPVLINDLAYNHAFRNDRPEYFPIEGAERLLMRSESYDRDRRQWTVTLAEVGCQPERLLHQRVYGDEVSEEFWVADLHASNARPLTLSDATGLSRLDTSQAEPALTSWLSADQLWQGVLDLYGGELPTKIAQNGEVEERLYSGATLHPLGPESYLVQLTFSLRFTGQDRFESFSWVVRMQEDGAMQALFEPEEHITNAELRLVPERGVFFFGDLAVPLRDEPTHRLRAQAFPVDFHYRNMFSYDREQPGKKLTLDNAGRYVFDRFMLATNDEFVDFDRDGVPWLRERELGTSDTNQDSDGDGVNDGVELFFERDPAVQQSVTSEQRLGALGFSNMIMEWAPMMQVRRVDNGLKRDLLSHFFYPFTPSARVLCEFPIGAATKGWNGSCYDHELQEIGQVEFGKNKPEFITDEQVYLRRTSERMNIYTQEVQADEVDSSDYSVLGFNHAGGIIMVETGTHLDRSPVIYQRMPGEETSTISLSNTPIDLERVTWVSYLGHAKDGSLDFFGVDAFITSTPTNFRYNEKWLYAMRDERAVGLFEMRSLLSEAGLSPELAEDHRFGEIASVEQIGGYILRVDEINTRHSIYLTLDTDLGVTSVNAMPRMDLGAWWREGLMSLGTYRYRVALANNAKPSSRCIDIGGVIACDAEPGQIYMASAEIDESIYRQIVPLTAGLGDADVLMSVHQRGLWRYTPEGAMSPWIGERHLESLRLDAGITEPLDDFQHLSIRRDRRAVCGVSSGKLYTIALDEHGIPESLELIEHAQGVASACTWDAQRAELVWSDTSGKVFSGERDLRFDVGKQVDTLISLDDGRWIVADNFWAMRCLDKAGKELGVTGGIMGAALFDEQLIYVDDEFSGPGILLVDEFCSGEVIEPSPILDSSPGETFWTQVYRHVQGSILGSHTVLPRHTEVAVVAKDQVLVASTQSESNAFIGTLLSVPIRIRPDYPDISEKTAEHLGEKPYHTGMVYRASEFNVIAMANAPNTSLARSTSYYEQPELPEAPMMPEDAMPESMEEESNEPGGCAGCHTAPGSAPSLWCLLGLFALRRRRPKLRFSV